ncbi:type II secretion system F family protein [Celerinatantimonas diazotrophica]|uniref:Protein transport protein HofC/type IV pilus assembly protein PilC n=1 Tax=Celerinatantimonas diazotrophica TaxID=412034 RepID=A0A4R1K1U4_9GAMM|nr:type II secretion system F family protein [Celerinatantimonas diazotrophica]TCK57978.1 protein transport protein HofC/type IV pilus assembly protein PilC [Celerinatantimonas diazotrophica]CAG9297953.1 Type II secretion system protein F [Celerinatantimonas diazotrophica]
MLPSNLNCFYWQGINQSGQSCRGIHIADSQYTLIEQLELRQISLLKTHQLPRIVAQTYARKLSVTKRHQIIEQLANSLTAGLSVKQTLSLMLNSISDKRLAAVLSFLHHQISQGESLSESLRQSGHFTHLDHQFLYIAEQSGQLSQTCNYLAQYLTGQIQLRRRLIKALSYPLVVTIMAIGMFGFLLEFIVPQFTQLFTSLHTPLPIYTQWIIKLAALSHYSFEILILFVGLIFMARYHYQHHHRFKLRVDEFILHIPVLGKMIQLKEQVKLTTLLAATYQSGMPIKQSFECAEQICTNQVFVRQVTGCVNALEHGQSLYQAVLDVGLFNLEQQQLLKIAQESGTLATILAKIAKMDDDRLDVVMHIAVDMIEPIVMALVGLLIGGVIIAMYLPIFEIGNVIH